MGSPRKGFAQRAGVVRAVGLGAPVASPPASELALRAPRSPASPQTQPHLAAVSERRVRRSQRVPGFGRAQRHNQWRARPEVGGGDGGVVDPRRGHKEHGAQHAIYGLGQLQQDVVCSG